MCTITSNILQSLSTPRDEVWSEGDDPVSHSLSLDTPASNPSPAGFTFIQSESPIGTTTDLSLSLDSPVSSPLSFDSPSYAGKGSHKATQRGNLTLIVKREEPQLQKDKVVQAIQEISKSAFTKKKQEYLGPWYKDVATIPEIEGVTLEEVVLDGQRHTARKTEEGAQLSFFCSCDGSVKSVLKKAMAYGLNEQFKDTCKAITNYARTKKLSTSNDEHLKQIVTSLFFEEPFTENKFSFFSFPQREKLASLIFKAAKFGDKISVPEVSILQNPKDAELWSKAQFVPNKGNSPQSIETLDVDSVQQMALFDMVTGNKDRNRGNLLIGNDGLLHLIDHGLIFQGEIEDRSAIWATWRQAREHLTENTRQVINGLDAEKIITELKKDKQIKIDSYVQTRITEHIRLLKELEKDNPEITLSDLWSEFCASMRFF